MSDFPTVNVKVPATTANIGPGFDCLGAALTLHNRFQFTDLGPQITPNQPQVEIQVSGPEADRVQTDASNLVYQAFATYYRHLHQSPPAVQIHIQLGVPLARGLGSSATAIVAGLLGANELAGQPLDRSEMLELAIQIEGHPDNVTPALLGGCRLAATSDLDKTWTLCEIDWSPSIVPIVAIPNFELSTQAAREVLPSTCSYSTAVFNTAHLGLLLKGLETGQGDWLRVALQDQLHQPFRQTLIPGFGEVYQAAREAGVFGLVISGAGPTLLALSDLAQAATIAAKIQTTWAAAGVTAEVHILQLDSQGALVSDRS